MACFLVSAAEAAIVTVATQIVIAHEQKLLPKFQREAQENSEHTNAVSIPLSRKLRWLSNLLWGGSFLLAFEHVWHGEVTAWFPFLTAAGNPADAAVMLHEMSTVGVGMAALVTAIWGGMMLVLKAQQKKAMLPALAAK
jgi:hypothetical protein